MGIEIKIVDPMDNFEVAGQMLMANWKEAGSKIEIKLPDMRLFYEHLQRMGALFAAGAYDAGKLIGYCIVTIVPHPFNHAIKICNADGVFLSPDYRGGRVLAGLMKAVRKLAREHNVFAIQWHAPAGSAFAAALAARVTPLSNYFMEVLSYE